MGFVDLLVRTNAVFRVVGVSFHRDAVAGLKAGDPLILVCEEDNPHDVNAIRVSTPDGTQIGFVPADVARRIRNDSMGKQFNAVVDSERIFDGRVVGVDIRLTPEIDSARG